MSAFINRMIGKQEMTVLAVRLSPSLLSSLVSLFASHFCLSVCRVTAGYFRLHWSFSMCHCDNVRWHLLLQTILKKHLPQEWHHQTPSDSISHAEMTKETLFQVRELYVSSLLQHNDPGVKVCNTVSSHQLNILWVLNVTWNTHFRSFAVFTWTHDYACSVRGYQRMHEPCTHETSAIPKVSSAISLQH